MAVKKKAKKVEVVEVEAPVVEATETADTPAEKPILVTEAENAPESPVADQTAAETQAETVAKDDTLSATDNAQIFGPQPVEVGKSNKKIFWILIIVFTLLGATAGGVGIYLQNRGSKALTPSPTLEAAASPTPTPVVDLDKKAVTIQILNGSGITGAAKTAQDYLEGQGYTVSAVGNADTQDFQNTVIAIKADKKDYFAQLKKALAAKYTVEDQADTVASSVNYDVVITLGKN